MSIERTDNIVNNFQDEKELESRIAKHPELLKNYQSENLTLWHRQIYLEGVGFPDLILIDENMVPVFVEVKLWKNAESRREIIGQLFDYVSFFSSIANQGMRKVWDIKLENAIKKICNNNEVEDIQNKISVINRNLSIGQVRLVLAFDELDDINTDNIKNLNKENKEYIKYYKLKQSHKEHLLRLLEFYNSNNNLKIELYEIIYNGSSKIIKPYYTPVKYYSMDNAKGDCSSDTWNIFVKVFDNLVDKYHDLTINAIQLKYKDNDEKGTEGQIIIMINNYKIAYFNLNKRHIFNIRLPYNFEDVEFKKINKEDIEIKKLGQQSRVISHFKHLIDKHLITSDTGCQLIKSLDSHNKGNEKNIIDDLSHLLEKFIDQNLEKLCK